MRRNRLFHTGWRRNLAMLILQLFCFAGRAGAQDIEVGARLDKICYPHRRADCAAYFCAAPVKSDIVFPLLKDSIGKIKIVGSPKADTVSDRNHPGQETITHHYTITCFDTGVYVISGLELTTKTGSFKTGTVTLEIKPVLVDTTKAFYDIKQPFAVSYNFWDWLKDHWVMVSIILACTAGGLCAVPLFQKQASGCGCPKAPGGA